MSKAFATTGLSVFEAAVLRALVDLDSFTRIPDRVGFGFTLRALQARSGQHDLKGDLWKRWLDLVANGYAEKTGDPHTLVRGGAKGDRFRITDKGREALAAHEAMA